MRLTFLYETHKTSSAYVAFVPPLLLHRENHYLQLLSPDASGYYITKVSPTQAKTPSQT